MSEYLTQKGRTAAWDLFSRVANLAFTATAFAAVIVAIFAQPIVDAELGIAPGFAQEQRQLMAELMRLNLVATIIFSISGLVMASLQANQHFLLPATAPILYNVGQIIGALYFTPRYGIHGLVYGVILGAFMHLLIQVPAMIKYGFRWTPSLDLRDTGLLVALKLMGPRLLTMGGIQMIVIARDNLASRTGQEGAVTALTYGWMIMQVPETLIGTAIAIALLPTLSELAAERDWAGFRQTVEKALRILISLTLPVAAVMAAGLHPLVRGVFGFDEANSILLTWTARVYLLTLAGYAVQETLVRTFYARQEPWPPFFGVLIRLAIYLALGISAILFFPEIGAPAIAFAEIAATVEAVVLFIWLNKRLPERTVVRGSLLKGLAASLIGAAAAYSLAVMLPGGAIITAMIGITAGGLIVLPIIWKEARLLFNL
jgi:putative peptidoglycan lipid II flippase